MSSLYIDEACGSATPGQLWVLRGPEARHAISVCRIRVGETLTITNGDGCMVTGSVENVADRGVGARIARIDHYDKEQPEIILVQALAKGGRDELAIQAATELGVAGVVAWQAKRSISRWEGAKVERGYQRWVSIVREASKQSFRPFVPWVGSVMSTSQLSAACSAWNVVVLDPKSDTPLTAAVEVWGESSVTRPCAVVVGPEGGIDNDELTILSRAGAQSVRLGNTVLRTSTAGPAAIAVLNTKYGRW